MGPRPWIWPSKIVRIHDRKVQTYFAGWNKIRITICLIDDVTTDLVSIAKMLIENGADIIHWGANDEPPLIAAAAQGKQAKTKKDVRLVLFPSHKFDKWFAEIKTKNALNNEHNILLG